MIVLPCPAAAREALGRYLRLRRLAAGGGVIERMVCGAAADRLGAEHGFETVDLRAHVPRLSEASIAPDGLSILVRGEPWWRAMLAVAVVDRVGGWYDPTFQLAGSDVPWSYVPAHDDFALELVGTRRVLDTVRLLHAGMSASIATAAARHMASRPQITRQNFAQLFTMSAAFGGLPSIPHPPRVELQAFLLGGVAAVVDALSKLGEQRRAVEEAHRSRTAMVRYVPPLEDLAPPEGYIDMHRPEAHQAPPEVQPAVMAAETVRLRDHARTPWVAGFTAAAEGLRHAIATAGRTRRAPLHLADLDLPS